ncbi:hypothetical protein RN001_003909 [Aquatica leii]|uniref:Kinesin motor domain-containing protein n=1 Tax=Aquatica leii TaxID=1421715 RepID=A0AAN7SRR5_9COLE|nr:hypothetical protein RN001_003909 [Aquatica leii]
MEMNVETAVRICPTSYPNRDLVCVQSDVYNNTIKLGNLQSIPVQHALPFDCTQNTLYATIVTPLMNYYFEGCDVSILTYGQSGTGKSYTLLGPTLNCALSEKEHGVIPRFLRQMFGNINQDTDKHFLIHVAWTQICGENVFDLLGSGSVECSNVSDAFELLKLGMSNIIGNYAHTLFTITLEQQYFLDGTVQHKISTASFIDLASSDKIVVVDNNGLTQYLPTDIGLLTLHKCIWMLSEMCTYNPNLIPYNQSALTMLLKDSFGGRAKTLLICCVSPLVNDYMETLSALQFLQRAQLVRNYVTVNSYTTYETYENADLFGLQFATNQLFKLVSNAENLFKNLLGTGTINKSQMEQISDWLMLKQECQECISESSEPHRSLDIIEEEIEDRCKSEGSESESDIQNLVQLMNNFRVKTDNLVSHVSDSVNTPKESKNSQYNEYHLKGARGRRASIHSANDFSPLLNYNTNSTDTPKPEGELNTQQKEKLIKQVNADIEGYEKQIQELLLTMNVKEKLMQQLLKHKQTKVNVRKKLKQKCLKLQNDQNIAQNKLKQAKTINNHLLESKLDFEISELSKKINETEFIKSIAEDDSKTITELEGSLNSSRKQLEKLRKCLRRKEKCKLELENDLKHSKKFTKAVVSKKPNSSFNSREITFSEDFEDIKHEIKELRRTRDRLLEQRYKLDTKSHSKKLLNDVEEQLLLQYEEAIEVIDLAIEYKNQKICGLIEIPNKDESIYKLLMQQFHKLNTDEILVLLRKYYQKVIELRSSTKKLEQQVVHTESQNENLLRQIQNLSLVLQRVRSEAERRVLSLEQQHDHKLQLIMHHLSQEGGGDDKQIMSRMVERSKQTALALQVAQGRNKQMNKGSLIARFTRYARQETVPQQLSTALTPSQAKVTRQKNKLIIQQSSK